MSRKQRPTIAATPSSDELAGAAPTATIDANAETTILPAIEGDDELSREPEQSPGEPEPTAAQAGAEAAEVVMIEVPLAESNNYPIRRLTRDLTFVQAQLVQRIAAGLRRDCSTLSSGNFVHSPDDLLAWFLERVARGEAQQ